MLNNSRKKRTLYRWHFFFIMIICFSLCNSLYAQEEIKLNKETSGLYTIPCEVNGLRLRFILDTGASDVSISLTEASFMYKNGYLEENDFLGTAKTLIASGEVQENYVVNLKQIRVGTKVLNNVKAVVVNGLSAPLLLGQSVLSQLGEWSIRDNYLILHNRGSNDFSKYTETDWKQRIEETRKNSNSWDDKYKYLLPGVLANDYNTIIRAGYILQYTKDIELREEEIVLNKLKELAYKGDKNATFELGYFFLNKARSLDEIEIAKNYFNKLIDGRKVFIAKEFEFDVYNTAYINLYQIYKKHLGLSNQATDILQKGALLSDADCVTYLIEEYNERGQYQNVYLWATKLSQTCVGLAKARALYWKGKCLIEGIGTKRNIQQGILALETIIKGLNINHEDALKLLCEHYMGNNFKLVEEYALKITFEKFYRNYYLGCAYYFMKDYASARTYFKGLWTKDNYFYNLGDFGYASCLLGTCYEEGLGGSISYKDAEKCYMYAYEECHYFAALGYLGDMMSNDKIYQNPNYKAAFGCYLQGAKNNDPYCSYRVSLCYKLGIGTNEDEKQSTYWLQKAKENGWKEQ